MIHIDRKGWRWWYLGIGKSQPFKRFGHSGWICLNMWWFKRFWNFNKPKLSQDQKCGGE